MKYADMKLKEEEQRAMRYLETRKGCNSVACVSNQLVRCAQFRNAFTCCPLTKLVTTG